MNVLGEDLHQTVTGTMNDPRLIPDAELERRTREILIKRGYLEALTMPSSKLVKLARREQDRS
jgi:hypothetical protein